MSEIIEGKKKIAFVGSGGAVKAAAFHIGVGLALEKNGFSLRGGLKADASPEPKPNEISVYVGSSAGAFFGAMVAAGLSIEDIQNTYEGRKVGAVFKRMSYRTMLTPNLPDPVLWAKVLARSLNVRGGGLENLVSHFAGIDGFFTVQGIERYLREQVLPTNDFSELAVEFYAVATQLNQPIRVIFGPKSEDNYKEGHAYKNYAPISRACAASMALPPVFAPYAIENRRGDRIYYFDGEIRRSLSLHVARDAGADLIVASYTHEPYAYTDAVGSLTHYGLPAIIQQMVYQMVEQKIQAFRQGEALNAAILNDVYRFCRESGMEEEKLEELMRDLEKKLVYRRNRKYIFINPDPLDQEFFFTEHFNLSRKSMGRIVRKAYNRAMHILGRYRFEFN